MYEFGYFQNMYHDTFLFVVFVIDVDEVIDELIEYSGYLHDLLFKVHVEVFPRFLLRCVFLPFIEGI
jgi:hypothetical protein